MNAKRRSLILTIAVLILALALVGLAACSPSTGGVTMSEKPAIQATPAAPVPSAMPSGGVELTILASGSGVTVLEYEGAGVRCIIASGTSVDMVCQNTAPTVPAQPAPTEQPKHQVPNGSSEA